MLKSKDFIGFFQEYQNETDRAVAVLAAAFLDEELRQLLAGFFINDEKETEGLLGVDRPLGSFSARTAAAYCLGLLSKEDFQDLNTIRSIRNDFAHQLHGLSFGEPSIAQKCDKLLAAQWVNSKFPGSFTKPRDMFMGTTVTLVMTLAERITTIDKDRRQTPPRTNGSTDRC